MVSLGKNDGGRVYSTGRAQMRLSIESKSLIRLTWRGIYDDASQPVIDAYLADFLELARDAARPLHMLHDLTELERYSKMVLVRHSDFATRHEDAIGRIAVVSRKAMVFLGVATVALWQQRPIRHFEDTEQAKQWLGDDEPEPVALDARNCG